MAFGGKNPSGSTGLPAPAPGNTVTSLEPGFLYGTQNGTPVVIDPDNLLGAPTDLGLAPVLPAASVTLDTKLAAFNPSTDPAAEPFATTTPRALAPLFGGGTASLPYIPLPETDGLIAHYDVSRTGVAFSGTDFGAPSAVGGRVGLLDDASGLGRLTIEGQENVKPSFVEVVGRRAVRFDGPAATRLTNPAGPNWMAVNGSDVTFGFVFRTGANLGTGGNVVASIFNETDGAAGVIILGAYFGTTGNGNVPSIVLGRYGTTAGEIISHNAPTQPNTLYVGVARSNFSGNRLDLNVNGVNAPQLTTPALGVGTDFNRFQLGAERYGQHNLNGDLIELVVYRRYLDAYGVDRLRRYFLNKLAAILALAVSFIPADQIYQTTAVSGASAAVAISTPYTGAQTSIEAAAADFGTSRLAAGGAWQGIAAGGGAASGTVAVPAGGPYAAMFRDSADGVARVAPTRFFVGDCGVLYGQSNMAHFFQGGFDYIPSQPRARKQGGGGWNLLTNSQEENPLPRVPDTAYRGIVNPAFEGIPGESQFSRTNKEAIGRYAEWFITHTGRPHGVFPYAVDNTDASYWRPGSGAGWQAMLGSEVFRRAPFTFDASFAIRAQGENAVAGDGANGAPGLAAALVAERNGWWAATGRNATSFKFGVVTLGSTTGYGVPGYFGRARAVALAFILDPANGAYYAGNPIDCTLNDSVHWNDSSLVQMGFRYALTSARALGRPVSGSTGAFTTGAGPRVTGITRSGTVRTLAVGDMDGSTALLTGDGGTTGASAGGFRVFNALGGAVAISSVAFSGAAVVLTLPAGTAFPVTVDHCMADAPYGSPPVPAQVVRGNNNTPGTSFGSPLWPFAAVSVA